MSIINFFRADKSESILQSALAEGTVHLEFTRMSIHGASGSGKTCLQHLLLNEPPPSHRESTDITTAAVKAMGALRDVKGSLLTGCSDSPSSIDRVDRETIMGLLIQGIKTQLEEDSLPSAHHSSVRRLLTRIQDTLFRRRTHQKSQPPKDQHFSVSREMLSLLPSEPQSNALFRVRWMYCIDSGGQQAFQDVAPAFIRPNSLIIITLRYS